MEKIHISIGSFAREELGIVLIPTLIFAKDNYDITITFIFLNFGFCIRYGN